MKTGNTAVFKPRFHSPNEKMTNLEIDLLFDNFAHVCVRRIIVLPLSSSITIDVS